MWMLLLNSTVAYGDDERARIEQFINDVMEEHDVPGMLVAIVKVNLIHLL